jgi:hypothetical protein
MATWNCGPLRKETLPSSRSEQPLQTSRLGLAAPKKIVAHHQELAVGMELLEWLVQWVRPGHIQNLLF